MQQNGHEKRLAKLESETAQIKKQIMQLEFQTKKEVKEAQRQSAQAKREFEERDRQIQARFDYLAKLTGITYEELDNLDSKVTNAGRILSREREHSKIG